MYQILISQKQSIVYATITSTEDWLLVYPLFSKLDTQRFSLQTINTCLTQSFNGNSMPINEVKNLLKERIALLSLLVDVLAKDRDSISIDVLNAVLYHQRTTKSLSLIFANMPVKTIISQKYLQQQLTALGLTTAIVKKRIGDRREVLNIPQHKDSFLRKVSYSPCYR